MATSQIETKTRLDIQKKFLINVSQFKIKLLDINKTFFFYRFTSLLQFKKKFFELEAFLKLFCYDLFLNNLMEYNCK